MLNVHITLSVAKSVKMLNIKTFTQIFVLILITAFTSAQISPLPGWSSCGKYTTFLH